MDLVGLLKRAEGKTLEFKRDLSSPEKALRSIVAFANTAGGTVLIGVEDGTRHVRGVKDPLALEERLANLIHDSIQPALLPEIEILPWRRTHVVAVEVYPGAYRPHFLKALGPEAGVFVRIGSTDRRADAGLIQELARYARNEAFDEQPVPDLDSEAIDFRAASECFSRKLRRADLLSLRLTTCYQAREVPTIGGLLLFGTDRAQRFPDAWIQAGRFAGADRRQIIDTLEIRSIPVRAVEEAVAFVRRNSAHEVVIGEIRHTQRSTFPPAAVREAIVNAVAHADYSQRGAPIRVAIFADRLEVENPGLLPFGLTIEDIQQGISKLRNRVIGRIFHELGLIEQWGSGIQRMAAACRAAGLDLPRFEEIGVHFRVTLSSVRRAVQAEDKVDGAILDALVREEHGLSTQAIATEIGRSTRATRTRLNALIDRGLVTPMGSGRRDPRRRYLRTERLA